MLNLVWDNVSDLFSGLANVVCFVGDTVQFSLKLSYLVGQAIVKHVLFISEQISNCFIAIFTLAQVLLEDSSIFFSDIVTLVKHIDSFLSKLPGYYYALLCYINSLIVSSLQVVGSVCFAVLRSVPDSIFFILFNIVQLLYLVRDAFVFIGSTFWSLITNATLPVVLLNDGLISLIVMSMKQLRIFVDNLKRSVEVSLINTVNFVTDIPVEAVYGICLGFSLLYLLFRYRNMVWRSVTSAVNSFVSQSHLALTGTWLYLETFTLQLITNQPAPNEAFEGPELINYGDFERPPTPGDQETDAERPSQGSPVKTKRYPEQDELLCVVCHDRERSTIILPCKHVCLCDECCTAVKRTLGRCPMCRNVVRRSMRVYM